MNQFETRRYGNIISCDDLIHELLATTASTSKLLEDASDQLLKVEVLSQAELNGQNEIQIVREAKLFFESPDRALMYCISDFRVSNSDEDEIRSLKIGKEPIGKIFGVNDIVKSQIKVTRTHDSAIALNLKIDDTYLYHKRYVIFIRGKRMGIIREIFNKESIMRLWS